MLNNQDQSTNQTTELKSQIQPEIEATFINIDKSSIRQQLNNLGAKLIQAEKLMPRTVFYTDGHSFARVRDEGNRVTMSYKRIDQLSLSGAKEACLEINDYETGIVFLQSLGFKIKSVQETKRETWQLDGTEIDIDTWPWLPTFIEIEGLSEDAVKNTAGKLGFNMKNAIYGSVDEIYHIYYNVSCDDVNQKWTEIKFGDNTIPDWLVAKKRQTPLA